MFPANQRELDIDLNNLGRAIITWTASYQGMYNHKHFKSERLANNTPWIHPATMNDVFGNILPGQGMGNPRVEVDNNCRAILTWVNGGYVYKKEPKEHQ
ncbi:MAG: hypothetical protein R2877_05355 [Bdellovibrionota bacterium]